MLKLFKENVRIALGSIRTQLLRTILTVMIIALGITALVGILSVVAALENRLTTNFISMGSNTFSVTQYEMSMQIGRRGERTVINPVISYSQAKEFTEKYTFPFTRNSLSFTASRTAEIKFESKKTDPEIEIVGADQNFLVNSGLEITMGRDFTSFDVSNNNHVCILGSDFLKGIFKDVYPLGKVISIAGSKFTVIGVLKEKGSTFGNSQDQRVIIPLQIARSLFSAPGINYNLSVLVEKNEFLNQATDQAILAMRNVRKLNPVQQNNFGIVRSDDLINRITEITDYLDFAAIIISVITIFGSSIALMNIMIVSVTERTREIGVRKALGANRSTIAFQFFIETLVIGQLGGLVGILLGLIIGYIIAISLGFAFVIPWAAIIWAFIVSFLVAVVSGSYPALKAARLDPIEALRYE